MTNELPGYDAWKTRLPEEPYCDDPECICTAERVHKHCPIHGIDPDLDYDEWQDRHS
jgi:hypothetical protein